MAAASESTCKIHQAWIALGSNIRPEVYLPRAVRELGRLGTVLRVARVWQSAPVGDVHQADFCNTAVWLQTALEPLPLKQTLREIEDQLDRKRDPFNKNAARTIDLDLSLYDNLVCRSPELTLPDPELPSRSFLAVPLAELTPEYRHPETGLPLSEIARAAAEVIPLQARPDIVLCAPDSRDPAC